ncbi:phospholipase-like protein [Tanacetum coccineum]
MSDSQSNAMEYPATIYVRSKLHLFQLFKDRLNEDRHTLFKRTCFGPWLDIIYVENDDDGMIHYVLQKQCCSDDDNFDFLLIYDVNDHSLHFGRREFCLFTGFKFGSISFREYRNGDIPFRNRLFPEKIGYDVKIIDLFALFYDEEKFSKLSNEDAIQLCLLLSLEVIFMGQDLVSVVDDVYLRIVNDLDAWNLFPWGDVLLFFMPAKPDSQQTYQDLSSDLSVLNGFCNNLSQTREEKGDCEHYKYTYSSKQEDQIIRLVDQRQQDHISNMAEVAEQKIQSEIQSLYNHREARLNKIAEEDKQRKCLGHMNSSAHMKLAIECCVPKKRKYVDVVRSSFCALPKILNVPSIKQLANQKNVLSPLMIEKCKSVKPCIEDLSRPFKRIDKNFLDFWNGLSALDDNRKGWLLDELTRQTDMDWAMVSSYFLPLLLQGFVPLFYANNDIFPVPWSNVERMRDCLKEKIPVVLKETGVFEKKNIDPAKYKISFKVADGVPKQGGVFGDCGVFLCMFLYRLANGIPLALDDPLQSALVYQEKLIHFYFKHKMFCP